MEIAGCQLFCFVVVFPLCNKNNYTIIQNWFRMVLRGEMQKERQSERGAWHDCTLFGVIRLSLEDLCVYCTATLCFSAEFWKMDLSPLCEFKKHTHTHSITFIRQWKAHIITNVTAIKRQNHFSVFCSLLTSWFNVLFVMSTTLFADCWFWIDWLFTAGMELAQCCKTLG